MSGVETRYQRGGLTYEDDCALPDDGPALFPELTISLREQWGETRAGASAVTGG
jgi:hypothetical protein